MCSHDPRLIPPDPDDPTKGISAFVGRGLLSSSGGLACSRLPLSSSFFGGSRILL